MHSVLKEPTTGYRQALLETARFSHALIVMSRMAEVGKEGLDFLTHTLYNGEYFDFIGNQGWYYKGKERAFYSQQPIDAGYLVEAYVTP